MCILLCFVFSVLLCMWIFDIRLPDKRTFQDWIIEVLLLSVMVFVFGIHMEYEFAEAMFYGGHVDVKPIYMDYVYRGIGAGVILVLLITFFQKGKQ